MAEELHFGKAAKRLHIAQPGLSQQIRVLEREVEAPLFDRGNNSVVLTPAGDILFADAQAILRMSDEALERVRSAADGRAGRLRVQHTRSLPDTGYEIVKEFRDAYPAVELEVETAWTTPNVELVKAQAADIAFVRLPLSNEPELQTQPLVNDELVVAVPTTHRLASRRSIRREDLAEENMVEWPRQQAPGAYDEMHRRIWGKRKPHVVREEPDVEPILAAVGASVGLAIVDAKRSKRMRPPGVELRQINEDPPVVVFGLCWRRDSNNPVIARFVEVASGRTTATSD